MSPPEIAALGLELVLLVLTGAASAAWVALTLRLKESVRTAGLVVGETRGAGEHGSVSVTAIVPMRDEASNARPCIESLLRQSDLRSIIAIDDCSTDGTYERLVDVAASDQRVRVVRLQQVPAGWVGKSYACHVGSMEARDADWLLFVDADVRLAEGTVRSALALAAGRGLDALSLIGTLRCPNEWDRFSTPFYFGLLNSFIPPVRVNDQQSSSAYFVGSFILIRRDAYEKVGGHAAVSRDVVEDRALGKLAKEKGLRIALESSPDALSAEWAPGFRGCVQALMRVSVPPMRRNLRGGALFALALSVLFLAPLLCLPVALVLATRTPPASLPAVLLASIGAIALGCELGFSVLSTKRFRLPPIPYALGFVPASLVYAVVLWRSLGRAARSRPVRWRGRDYAAV